jgi:uncharacterized iron-regulated membrane protein
VGEVIAAPRKSLWQRCWSQPQDVLLRRILLQVHLWAGVGAGLYIFIVCLTGSVLVYRNELYAYFTPPPTIVEATGTPLTKDQLLGAAKRAYPEFEVSDVRFGNSPNEAAEITVGEGEGAMHRLFHPYTGADLGYTMPAGFRFTVWMRDLHDNLLTGKTGRKVNGFGGLALVLLCVTGAVLWWPGSRNVRRSLWVDFRSNWKRINWGLHSALGFWFFLFVLMWGLTGAALALPDYAMEFFDWLEPYDPNSNAERIVDRIQYWMAYLHFGRLGGRGIPYCGRGLCDSISKATWAAAGLVPPILFVSGALMWWNRVLAPRFRRLV